VRFLARLREGRYGSVPDFSAELRRVFSNALSFFPPEHPTYKAARRLRRAFADTARELGLQVSPRERRPPPFTPAAPAAALREPRTRAEVPLERESERVEATLQKLLPARRCLKEFVG